MIIVLKHAPSQSPWRDFVYFVPARTLLIGRQFKTGTALAITSLSAGNTVRMTPRANRPGLLVHAIVVLLPRHVRADAAPRCPACISPLPAPLGSASLAPHTFFVVAQLGGPLDQVVAILQHDGHSV